MQPTQQAPSQLLPMAQTTTPSWAAEISSDIKTIKTLLPKVENIEKTADMDKEMETLEHKDVDTEKSCSHISEEFETHTKYLESAKNELNAYTIVVITWRTQLCTMRETGI